MKYLLIASWLVSGASVCFCQDVPDPGADTPNPAPVNETLEWNVCLAGTNAVPANDSPFRGGGTLSLSGGLLTYQVRLPFPNVSPTSAGIYGPATTETNGEVVVDWNNYTMLSGSPGSTFRGAWEYKGSCTLTPDQVARLKAGSLYVSVQSIRFPNGELRGRICPTTAGADSDGDGVPDKDDLCPNSPPGAVVDARGCSIQDLLPCNGPWSSHADYVQAIKEMAATFLKENRISFDDVDSIVAAAENSDCGNKGRPDAPKPIIVPASKPAEDVESPGLSPGPSGQ